MKINISDKLSLKQLLLFSLPTVISMIFMSFYTIIDGIFVARYVGSDALSGLNIAYPCYGILMAFATMFGTGGSAYIAHKMGQGKLTYAKQCFSFIFYLLTVLSLLAAFVSSFYIQEICLLLGSDKILLPYAVDYLSILMKYNYVGILQVLFLCFLATASKPMLTLWLSILGGITNIILDYIFIVHWHWGISGASYATVIGSAIPALGGLIFFIKNKKGLCFGRPLFSWEAIWKSMYNGSSEMISTVSVSFCCILINIAMMKFIGSAGVAAYTSALYCDYLMMSGFFGFSIGIAPHISFQYGAKHTDYLKITIKKCLYFVFFASLIFTGLFFLLVPYITAFFFKDDSHVFNVALFGLYIFGFSFLFKGINIFGSALFTALGNGKISAILAFTRTFVFILLNVYILSYFWQATGIWIAIPLAEAMALGIFICYFGVLKKHYNVL